MATYEDILEKIAASIEKFNKGIPHIQQGMLDGITEELSRLDLRDGDIKATVANLRVIARIKNKLNKLILTDEYKGEVKDFAKSFNEITQLQNAYWKGLEKTFKPRALLQEIKTQAISDTVDHLTASGIGANISSRITDILKANITTGGSMKSLTKQLRQSLTNAGGTDGLLTKYAKQITTDSINQYSAQYTQVVSSDLGFEWFAYQGSDIKTTRPFCDAMTDFRYFHVTEIPRLLRAEGLYYQKDGKTLKVPIYDRTGLPHGLIEGTNAANFMIRRGGYNCGHQIRPVSASLVKASAPEIYARVMGAKAEEPPAPPPPETKAPKPAGETISKQFTKIQKAMAGPTKEALNAIDSVHGAGALPDIPFEKDSKGAFRMAAFWSKPSAQGKVATRITLSNKATEPGISLVHEMGHFLDLEAIGKKGEFSSAVADSPMSGVMKAMSESKAIKEINQIIKTKKSTRDGVEVHIIKQSVDYFKYLASKEEQWARAYTQFIANRSGDKTMKDQMASYIERKKGEVHDHKQWDPEDFAPIELEIEKMMIELKWISR